MKAELSDIGMPEHTARGRGGRISKKVISTLFYKETYTLFFHERIGIYKIGHFNLPSIILHTYL